MVTRGSGGSLSPSRLARRSTRLVIKKAKVKAVKTSSVADVIEHKSPSLSDMGVEIVDLMIGNGSGQRLFRVHKKLLCTKIPYFDRMFNGVWKEAIEGVALFPEDDTEAFEALLGWVYSGEVKTLENDEDPLTTLFHLYTLSCKFLLPAFSHQILNTVIHPLRINESSLSPSGIRNICAIAPSRSGLWFFGASLTAYILVQKECPVCGIEELESLFEEFGELQHAVLSILRNSAGSPVDPRTLEAAAFDEIDGKVSGDSP